MGYSLACRGCFNNNHVRGGFGRGKGRGGRRKSNGLPFDLNNNGPSRVEKKNPVRKDPIFVEPCESPKDASGRRLSVPMKLEMERREDETPEMCQRLNELMIYYRREFVAKACNYKINIVAEERMEWLSDGRRCGILFQVVCSNWQSTLPQFIHKFFIGIKRNRGSPIFRHEMPMISTHSLLLYPLRLVNSHDNLPLASIQFGSLVNNGLLGIHWNMTGGSLTGIDKEIGFYFHKAIYAYFEYDKRLIVVEYCSFESDQDMEYDVRGRITIEMSTIRRVFFDQQVVDGYDFRRQRISLVLMLDAPSKLQVQRRREKATGMVLANSPWEHRSELRRGDFPGDRSDSETLHHSKVVVLQFDTPTIKEKLGHQCYSLDSFFYDIISRLRHKTGKKIEYTSFEHVMFVMGGVRTIWWDEIGNRLAASTNTIPLWPYGVNPFFDATVLRMINGSSERLVDKERRLVGLEGERREYLVRWKAFRLRALLQGILDRGMEHRMELLHNRFVWYRFVDVAADRYTRDEERTLHTLERVMCMISEGHSCPIQSRFEKEWIMSSPTSRLTVYNEHERKEGYWRIMKLVVTPTRIIFVGYEVIMGNRVLNKYARNENHIIRVSFREDRGGPMRQCRYSEEVQTRIKTVLVHGITFAGRTFTWLGNSNSQLREQGCYMMHVDCSDLQRLTPHTVRCQMGDFHRLPNIPKMIARLGQVFTQCRRSQTALSPWEVGVTFDFTGGRNTARKPYVFSDGVGCISALHAMALSEEQGLHAIASACQIRFRGEKGLLCLDPLMDKKNELMKRMGRAMRTKVLVRPSMSKFAVMDEHVSNLEIVKFSSSSAVFLNRPLINILCQVSERQSAECHVRVRGRVEELLDVMLRETIQSLYVESKAFEAIREMSFPFSMEVFNTTSGLHLTTDPFFRSLLRANVKYVLQRQLSKMNIRIPSSRGRLMFGVVDTTGILQYGQVFCQYSGSVSKQGYKVRSIGGRSGIIHTGPIMITKNPCISSGDVRMFNAIDVPGLRHLVDVVVFPQHGPRPHPDEMAGSDLDGDEYMVIWDEGLFLMRNERASVFPMGEERKKWAIPRKDNGAVDFALCEERKAEFFTEAIVHGQPGVLCMAHLAVSDLYGLNSKPSISLAKKISQTLDYQKSGILPEEMTIETVEDPRDADRVIPAERSRLKPDFIRNYKEPGYESRGILGAVYREACKFDHALDCLIGEKEKIARDPAFLIPEWEKYRREVERELYNYSHALKSVVEHYGLASEEELLSGMFISSNNRMSDKEDEFGNFFTSHRVIEGKVKAIIESTRETFFERLLDWRSQLDEVEYKRNDVKTESILNRRVKPYTYNIVEIRRKAAAAYNVAYDVASLAVERGEQSPILLSFPWVFYDVLLDIKTRPDIRIIRVLDAPMEYSNMPLATILSEVIDRYSRMPSTARYFAGFMRRFASGDSIVARSLRENEDLARASFVVVEWANHVGGLSERFGEEHVLSLFILFGLGEMASNGQGRRFIHRPGGDMRGHVKKGEHLLLFIDFLSSRKFRIRSSLCFTTVGGGILMRGEWRTFSETALSSFLSLVTTHRLSLPVEGCSAETAATTALKEYEARVMQLPEFVISEELEEVRDALCTVSRCNTVKLSIASKETVIVSAIGRSEQLRLLSRYIYPPAPPRESATLKGTIESLPNLTYTRLMKAAKQVMSR